MYKPAPINHHCIHDVLSHAMDNIPTDAGRWGLRCDAECSRDALLDALSFIGTAMQVCADTNAPPPFSKADLHRLSGFLLCAPALIRGMNTVIESYKEPATCEEARNV